MAQIQYPNSLLETREEWRVFLNNYWDALSAANMPPVERPFGQTQSGPDIVDELNALISSGALAGQHMDIVDRAIQEIEALRRGD